MPKNLFDRLRHPLSGMEGFSLNFHLLGVGIGPAAGILAYGVSRAHSLRVTRVIRKVKVKR